MGYFLNVFVRCGKIYFSTVYRYCVCKSHSCNSFLSEVNKDLHRRVRHKDLHLCVRLSAAPAQMSQVLAQLSPPLLPSCSQGPINSTERQSQGPFKRYQTEELQT